MVKELQNQKTILHTEIQELVDINDEDRETIIVQTTKLETCKVAAIQL